MSNTETASNTEALPTVRLNRLASNENNPHDDSLNHIISAQNDYTTHTNSEQKEKKRKWAQAKDLTCFNVCSCSLPNGAAVFFVQAATISASDWRDRPCLCAIYGQSEGVTHI